MPTKSVSWTQQPVVAADLQSVHFDRVSGGTSFTATGVYEVRDQTNAIRYVKSLSAAVSSWPANLNAILAAINTAEGT